MVSKEEILEEIDEIDSELKRRWIILKALKLLKREHEVEIGKLKQEEARNHGEP